MLAATPQGVIQAATRALEPHEEAPDVGDWLVCPNGHVLAQYVEKERTRLKDWGKVKGAVVEWQFGRRLIKCAICGAVALNSREPFACHVVPDSAVKKAVKLIG